MFKNITSIKIDHELLTACVVNPWAVIPRMMLVDSMIENGWEEFKAMESFEPPTLSGHLPSTYGVGSGYIGSGGIGGGGGRGRGNCNGCGNGRGLRIGFGNGYGNCYGSGDGII